MNSKLCTLCDDLELHQRLFRAGLRAAAYRLPTQDQDDCGIEFYLYMRHKRQHLLEQYRQGKLPEIWLFRCANHFAQNYARHLRHVQNYECDWLMLDGEAADDANIPTSQPSPNALLCRRELRQRFSRLISELNARQVRYLLLHCVERQSYVQIAADHGENEDAIRMTVSRACKRLHTLCVKSGLDRAELEDYLSELRPPHAYMMCKLNVLKNAQIAKTKSLHPFAFANGRVIYSKEHIFALHSVANVLPGKSTCGHALTKLFIMAPSSSRRPAATLFCKTGGWNEESWFDWRRTAGRSILAGSLLIFKSGYRTDVRQ